MKRLVMGLLVLGAASGGAVAGAQGAGSGLTIANSVVLTRADGSVVPLAQRISVWCGQWARDVPTPAIHVLVGDRRSGSGVWHLSAVVADVKRRRVVRFPHEFIWNRPTRAKIGGGDGRNEFTTAEEESSGRVVFSSVRCGRRLHIRFRVNGVIGSEFFDGTPVTVRGSFSARG